jgi:anti-anti-sigma factor
LSVSGSTAIIPLGAPYSGRLVTHGSGDAARPLSFAKRRWFVVSEERFPATWSGQTAIIRATGEIDLTVAECLRDALLSAFNAGATALVVDLTATTFLDSAGVTALVRAARRASASEAALRVAVTSPAVLRVLDLVGINQLVPVYPSVAEALASLSAQKTVIDSSTQAPSGPDATET